MPLTWIHDDAAVDWHALSDLYRIAPLGEKRPEDLAVVFGRSMFKCFVYEGEAIVGVGRVLADGVDAAYIADVAVHPDHQGRGLGKALIEKLASLASGHKKILLYANPGAEGFYAKLGFHPMSTAMAIWHEPQQAIEAGILRAI